MARSPKPAVPRRVSRGCDPGHPVYELDLWLVDSQPLIWRSIAVPAEFDLEGLHTVIQCVMPWEECHLHQFHTKGGRRLLPPAPDGSGWDTLDNEEDSEGVMLREVYDELKQKLVYEYDFGDSWVHALKLVATHADAGYFAQLPICLAGQRAAPPEDSGGIYGYEEKLEMLRHPEPEDEWHRDVLEWMGDFDPEAFDLAKVNRELTRVFGRGRRKR